jgi:hypothetical protein
MLSLGVWPNHVDSKINWVRVEIEDFENVPLLPILEGCVDFIKES